MRTFRNVGQTSKLSSYGSIGALRGMCLGYHDYMQSQISKNTSDGNPSSPCLSVDVPSSWRFRWVVQPGNRSIYALAKQNSTGSVFRPRMTLKSNPNVGLTNDVSGSAPQAAGWVQIGPLSFVATATDVVWVELSNNAYSQSFEPALFDHIITS